MVIVKDRNSILPEIIVIEKSRGEVLPEIIVIVKSRGALFPDYLGNEFLSPRKISRLLSEIKKIPTFVPVQVITQLTGRG